MFRLVDPKDLSAQIHRYQLSTGLALTALAAAMLLTYNVVSYRELHRQGEGGELMKIKWWFTPGGDLKGALGTGKNLGLGGALFMTGRRDFALLAWLVLALVGLVAVVPFYVLAIAAVNCGAAVVQLYMPRSSGTIAGTTCPSSRVAFPDRTPGIDTRSTPSSSCWRRKPRNTS